MSAGGSIYISLLYPNNILSAQESTAALMDPILVGKREKKHTLINTERYFYIHNTFPYVLMAHLYGKVA